MVNDKFKEVFMEFDKIFNGFLKDNGNGLMLNGYEIDVLTRYNFDYKKYNSLSSLIFDIDNYINEEGEYTDILELEDALDSLSERHYYNEVNK